MILFLSIWSNLNTEGGAIDSFFFPTMKILWLNVYICVLVNFHKLSTEGGAIHVFQLLDPQLFSCSVSVIANETAYNYNM